MAPRPDEPAVGASAAVLSTQADVGRREGGVGVDPAELRSDLPHPRAPVLDAGVAEARGPGDVELDHGDHEGGDVGRPVPLQQLQLRVGSGPDDESGVGDDTFGVDPVDHHHRLVDGDAGGDGHEHGIDRAGIVQGGEHIRPFPRHRAQCRLGVGPVDQRAGVEAPVRPALGDLGQHHGAVAHDHRGGTTGNGGQHRGDAVGRADGAVENHW